MFPFFCQHLIAQNCLSPEYGSDSEESMKSIILDTTCPESSTYSSPCPESPKEWSVNLSTTKCLKLTRPLLAKIHKLVDLHDKNPTQFQFDVNRCSLLHKKALDSFINPSTSQQRLLELRPFLQTEVFEAFCEIFMNFKKLTAVLFDMDLNPKRKRHRTGPIQHSLLCIPGANVPRLTTLAALKMGKSIALGTKTSFQRINQAMAFNPDTFPQHLRQYCDDLEDNIEPWLSMEPQPIFGRYTNTLLFGYVIHILVMHLNTLFYTLIPVLLHWLEECRVPVVRCFFSSYWNFSRTDGDLKNFQDLLTLTCESSKDTFWLFYKNGYWQNLVTTLQLTSSNTSRYDVYCQFHALMLDAFSNTDKLDIKRDRLKETYRLMRLNSQYSRNSAILTCIIALFIESNSRGLAMATLSKDTHNTLLKTYVKTAEFALQWLALNDNCIFHFQDNGNIQIFNSLLQLSAFNHKQSNKIVDYLLKHSSRRKIQHLITQILDLDARICALAMAIQALRSFYLNVPFKGGFNKVLPEDVAESFRRIFEDDLHGSVYQDFLDWLSESNDANLNDLGESILERFCDLKGATKRRRLI